MAISNNGELKTAIGTWLARSDLATQIPEFISMCETRIAYGSEAPFEAPPVRVKAMQTSADLSLTAGVQTVAEPTGFLENIRLYLDSDPNRPLDYVSPQMFWGMRGGSETGKPTMFTSEGGEFVFGPTPDNAYTGKLLFVKKFDALVADGDTNWLLTNAPNVYLYGSLLEAAPLIRNQKRLQEWYGLYRSGVRGLNNQMKWSNWGNSPQIRTDYSHVQTGFRR